MNEKKLSKKLKSVKEVNKKLSFKYLIKAQLTLTEYNNKNRFNEADEYFNKSLELNKNENNLFMYARFLEDQKEYSKAKMHYNECLKICEKEVIYNPKVYKPVLATTLNNLANLYSNQGKYKLSEEYYERSKKIYQELIINNPKVYKSDLDVVLKNLNNKRKRNHE